MNVIISSCLIGCPCRYDGKPAPTALSKELLKRLSEKYNLISVCPEILAGFPVPRDPAEISGDGRVISKSGKDVTALYNKGAEATLAIAEELSCTVAILKSKSPSCGSKIIYDGSFSGKLILGNGVTVELLAKKGIMVICEDEIDSLL